MMMSIRIPCYRKIRHRRGIRDRQLRLQLPFQHSICCIPQSDVHEQPSSLVCRRSAWRGLVVAAWGRCHQGCVCLRQMPRRRLPCEMSATEPPAQIILRSYHLCRGIVEYRQSTSARCSLRIARTSPGLISWLASDDRCGRAPAYFCLVCE